MKYMLLIHNGDAPTPRDPEAWSTLSEAEQQAVYADYETLNRTVGVTTGPQIAEPATATTVRVKDGETVLTDGPLVSALEALSGFLVLEADDLDTAVALAARVPAARMGGAVEVRPLVEG